MKIDSSQYNGICSCGRNHSMQTEFCEISDGCFGNLNKYLAQYRMEGYTVAIYDQNTYKATDGIHPKADMEIILDPNGLHADEHGVEHLADRLPDHAEILIAIGSGTIHDLTRYCAYKTGAQFVSCPTAASVDGFCSSVAAMTWHGCKKTLTAVAPRIVIADTNIIKRAPIRLTRSGFGDMIGKYVALTDWKIANILTGEFYCERIAEMTLKATQAVLNSVQGILDGADTAYEKLTYGLLLSGLAMQMMGNSRPASGAEHHISHIIEMSPPSLNVSSDALHGEKVGVGTLLAFEEYKRMAKTAHPNFADYKPYSEKQIASIFGEQMATEIISENRDDSAKAVTAEMLEMNWEQIRKEIFALPDHKQLLEIYRQFGVKSELNEINVDDSLLESLLCFSHLVRNRLTLMRLRKCIKAQT